jgi:hypothetical protein
MLKVNHKNKYCITKYNHYILVIKIDARPLAMRKEGRDGKR